MFLLNPAAQSHGGNNTLLSHVGVLHVCVHLCLCFCVCLCVRHATYMMVHACQLGEQIWIEWNRTEMKLLRPQAASQRVEKLVSWALCV